MNSHGRQHLSRRLLKFAGSAQVLNVVLGIALAVQIFQNQSLVSRFSASPSSLPATVPDNAPVTPLSLLTLEGDEYRIDSNQGKRWLLIFFHTECQYCQAEIPLWKKLYERSQDRRVEVNAITLEHDVTILKSFAQTYEIGFPIFIDQAGKIFNNLRIRGTPTKILLAENGRVLHVWRGLTTQSAPSSDIINLTATFDLMLEDLPLSGND